MQKTWDDCQRAALLHVASRYREKTEKVGGSDLPFLAKLSRGKGRKQTEKENWKTNDQYALFDGKKQSGSLGWAARVVTYGACCRVFGARRARKFCIPIEHNRFAG